MTRVNNDLNVGQCVLLTNRQAGGRAGAARARTDDLRRIHLCDK